MNVSVEITTLTNGGDGLGRVNGKAIFVSGAVPGDVVNCRLDVDKKRYAKGTVLDIVTAAPQRIMPECPHFTICGGCDWQMLSYAEQCGWKERLLRENCSHQLDVTANSILPLCPSVQPFGYRSRAQFKCKQSAKGFHLGFYQRGSHSIVDIDSCPVVDPRINSLIPVLRQLFQETPYAGAVGQIDVAVGDGGVPRLVVHYSGNKSKSFCRWLLQELASDELSCWVQTSATTLVHIKGESAISISVDSPALNLEYAPGGFAQINLAQNRALVDIVVAAVCGAGSPCGRAVDQAHIFDLYCGMGNFALPLARRVRKVTGVEGNAGSINDARKNALANGLTNVDFHVANVEKFMQAAQRSYAAPDIVVLDPPRAGVKELLALLIAQRAQRIVYVSCDQQTMLRDVRELCSACYRVQSIMPVDMFPQTAHTEVVAILDLL
ncbi:MAG: class I SAM-dependent RNA methyltransferase [Desulfuromonas sp.]|nr:class I SAM-dependent RNA methyltransferase [Desulfuromonas sp.]